MTGTMATVAATTSRPRAVRWLLQVALLVGALGEPPVWFLLSAVLPLALDQPFGPLASRRGRLATSGARVLGLTFLVVGPSRIAFGVTPLLVAGLQSGLVFATAYVVSRSVAARRPRSR
jgi:hypothetical protein